MSTIMTREAAKFWWGELQGREFNPPPNIVHYYKYAPGSDWKTYTWQDLFAKRTARINAQIELKRRHSKVVPAFIWVFYNPQWIFNGWYIYIKTFKKSYSINFRHDYNEKLIVKAMQLFPCGVIPVIENFHPWCESFEKQFHRDNNRRKKHAVAPLHVCIDEFDNLTDLTI